MNNKRLLIAALVLTAALTVCRVLLLPAAMPVGTRRGTVSFPLLGIMAAAVAAALWAGYRRGEYQPLARPGSGRVAVVGLLFGGLLLSFTAVDAYEWAVKGILTGPWSELSGGVEQGALIVELASGILAGMFLMVYFVGWKGKPYAPLNKVIALPMTAVGAVVSGGLIYLGVREETIAAPQILLIALGCCLLVAFLLWQIRGRFPTGWLWLLPPLWVFARLVRYDVHYAMSVDVSAGVYELFVYGVAALFTLSFAKYISGAMKPGRHMRGLACAAAALCLSAFLARFFLAGDVSERFSIPDWSLGMLGVFALTAATALSQREAPTAEPAAEGNPET